MQTPTLSHKQWLLLGPLINGGEKTTSELREQCAHKYQKDFFHQILHHANADGLIETVVVVFKRAKRRRKQQPTYRTYFYRITPAGRRAWQESLDWYIQLGNRSAATVSEDRTATTDRVLSRSLVKRSGTRRSGERRPDAEEDVRLMAAAKDRFRPLYLFIRRTKATYGQLALLDVETIDQTAVSLAMPNSATGPTAIDLDDELRDAITSAANGRLHGPLFVFSAGRRWTAKQISREFFRLRTRLQLPHNVSLRGPRTENPTSMLGIERQRRKNKRRRAETLCTSRAREIA